MPNIEKISDEREQKELLKKALGLLKVLGQDTPAPTIGYLKTALNKGICTREDIDNALKHYSETYGVDYLKKLFN